MGAPSSPLTALSGLPKGYLLALGPLLFISICDVWLQLFSRDQAYAINLAAVGTVAFGCTGRDRGGTGSGQAPESPWRPSHPSPVHPPGAQSSPCPLISMATPSFTASPNSLRPGRALRSVLSCFVTKINKCRWGPRISPALLRVDV